MNDSRLMVFQLIVCNVKMFSLLHTIFIAARFRINTFCDQSIFFFLLLSVTKYQLRMCNIDTNMFSISRHTNEDSIQTFIIWFYPTQTVKSKIFFLKRIYLRKKHSIQWIYYLKIIKNPNIKSLFWILVMHILYP